jgi:hypothetical protein
MTPLTGVTVWAVAFGFVGGLAGGDSLGIAFVALSACLQSCAAPRAPWRWATLALAGWAGGSIVALLIVHAGAERYFEVPDGTESSFAVLAALTGAYIGAVLTWIAGRLAREP